MDERTLDSLRDPGSLNMPTPQPLDDSPPSMVNRRRARPFSLLSYNPTPPQISSSPSPHHSDSHTRHASFSSTSRPNPPPRTPLKRPSRWTVIIIPPPLLPHSPPPPHVSGFAHGYGPSGRYSTGLILPLQPTLTLQLTSIAREFSLPSTGGLSLHLSISSTDQPSIPGPRVTDESWTVLFGWTFEENAPAYGGLQPSTGLPIAGRLEFDIDLKKARWFDAWASSSQPTNRSSSQVQYSLKLTSAHSTPTANRASDLFPSSATLAQSVRTQAMVFARRGSAQSSTTYDQSRESSKPLPIPISEHIEDDLRSPTDNHPSGSQDNPCPVSPSTHEPSETFRQQLERLVESEDSALAEENNWHIQQENMLRQAAYEREQIELADQLEEERRIEEENQNMNKVLFQNNQQTHQNPPSPPAQRPSSQNLPSMKSIDTNTSEPSELQPSGNEQQVTLDSNQIGSRSLSGSADEMRENEMDVTTSARSIDGTPSDPISSKETREKTEIVDLIAVTTQEHTEMVEQQAVIKQENTETMELHTEAAKFEMSFTEEIEPTTASSTVTRNFQSQESNTQKSIDTSQLTNIAQSTLEEQVVIKSPKIVEPESTQNVVVTARPISDSQATRKSGSSEEVDIKRRSESNYSHKTVESTNSSFSTILGRPVNRFSGEQELMKRRTKTEQGDEETQKLIDEMNRLVHEKAMAKEASILSNPNPKRFVTDDNPSPIKSTPPIKSTLKANPPPPPTRSKVVQLAKAFSPSEESPWHSGQPSPRSDTRTRDNSPAIPAVPVLPSPPEPEPDLRPISPIIQGPSLSSPAIPSVPLPPPPASEPRREPQRQPSITPRDSISKSTPSSVSSSPSTRKLSLFKPSHFISSIFRTHSASNSIDLTSITSDPLAPVLHCYATTDSLSEQLANYIVSMQDQALERHKKFVVAISGGSLPKILASGLLENPNVKWDTWKVFYADEKIVPLDHPESNFANSMEALFSKVPIDRSQLVSILGLPTDEIDLNEMGPLVSSIYMAQILEELDPSLEANELPRFDLVLLGVGEDGHTCSLFPSHRLLDDAAIISWCDDSPVPPVHRITLTLPVLNTAHNLAFVCDGSGKDEILRLILEHEPSPTRPASLVKLAHRPVVWFVDEAAAAKTQYPRTIRESDSSDRALLDSQDPAIDPEPAEHVNLTGLQLEGLSSYPDTQVASMDKSILNDNQISPVVVCRDEEEPVSFSLVEAKNDLVGFPDELRYPYNLQIYPAVYPHIEQRLYCPPVPQISIKTIPPAPEVPSPQSIARTVEQCPTTIPNGPETVGAAGTDGQTWDAADRPSPRASADQAVAGSGYPFSLSIYPPVYPNVADLLYPPAPGNLPLAPVGPLPPLVSRIPGLVWVAGEDLVEDPAGVGLLSPLVSLIPGQVQQPVDQQVEQPLVGLLPPMVSLIPGQAQEPVEEPEVGLLPPMVSLIPNQVEEHECVDNLSVRQEVNPTTDHAHVEDRVVENSSGYPEPIARSNQDEIIRQPKRVPAPLLSISSNVSQTRGLDFEESTELECPQSDRIGVAKSPVAVLQSTLNESFYVSSQSSQPASATRVFSPSVQYAQQTTPRSGLAISPLALRAAPSTLEQGYYEGNASTSAGIRSQDAYARAPSELALSPVRIIPSTLPESFYHTESAESGITQRLASPAAAFQHPGFVRDRFPGLPPAALLASPSALSDAFFASARSPSIRARNSLVDEVKVLADDFDVNAGDVHGHADDVHVHTEDVQVHTEDVQVQSYEKTTVENSTKNSDRQDGVDRQSEGSYSHFSKGESINSRATLHQSTDDDWPPTPHSSDRLPSPDSTSGLVASPPLVREVDGSSAIKPQFSGPNSLPPLIMDQSSSALIEADQTVSISSISQASMLSPSIAKFHDGSMIADSHGSDSQSYITEPPLVSTPRAAVDRSLRTTIEGTLVESDQQVSMSSISEASLLSPSIAQFHSGSGIEVSGGSDLQAKDSFELQAESTPRASIQSPLESIEIISKESEFTNTVQSTTTGLDSHNHQLQQLSNQHISQNGLGIDLGQSVGQETHNDPSNGDKLRRRLSNLETTGEPIEDGLIQSSDQYECQITPLDKFAEMTWNKNFGDPTSPSRLPSPSLIERLILTPNTSPSIDKQFPAYDALLTSQDKEKFNCPPTIEVAWDYPQVPLAEVGFGSPPRPLHVPLSSYQHEHTMSSLEQRSFEHDARSDDQDAESLITDETTKTEVVSEAIGQTSPFFLDQGSNLSGSGFHQMAENLSPPTSPVHAIFADGVVPVPASQKVTAERSFSVSDHSPSNSPLLPPLNLAMDLSDPLSAASTARLDGYESRSTTEGPGQTPSEQSFFGDQSNGFNLDQVVQQSGPSSSGTSSEELVTEPTMNITEPLPSITKRAPTPSSDEVGIALEPVSIEESSPPPPPPPILLPFQDLAELSEALAQFIFEAQEVSLQRHNKFQIALGGSVLPQIVGAGLAGDDRMQWDKWEIFLVEEAIAPLGSPESVLTAITESIVQHVPIPRSQVHSIAELTKADLAETEAIAEGLDSLADSLADEYENKLLELFPEASHDTGQPPEFDLILISVGEEGQVGSLYPSHPMLGEANWFVAWLGDAWEPPSHRITLTLPVLNAAHQFAFLAIGEELAEIVADGLDRSIQSDVPMDEDRVNPTALVKSSSLKPVVWFTDFAAASLTDYPKSTFWDDP